MPNKEALRLVTYCGLHCGLCAQRARIPKQAVQLQETLNTEGLEDFYQYAPDIRNAFPEFKRFLEKLARFDCSCRVGTGGSPDCKIRNCARSRNVEVCALCSEYPCPRIQPMADRYPLLLTDGKHMKEIGVERWVEEQERRAKSGFSYSDIRHPRKQHGST